MAIRDPKRRYAGFTAVPRGMNSGNAPDLLGSDELSFLINGTCRGGQPKTRPGMRKIALSFEAEGDSTNFQTKLWQGASPYQPATGRPYIVASIGGRYFRIMVPQGAISGVVRDISIPGSHNNYLLRRAWFVQGEEFLIGQDGESRPIIFDGATCRRALANEVPAGTVMVYALGRLWVTRPTGQSFVAGDIVYGPTGTALYGGRDAILRFTENTFLNEGGDFVVPLSAGPITAMRALANLDTSLGQGPIQIFTSKAAASLNPPFNRDEWKNTTFPIQTASLVSYGAYAQNSTINVNSDIWYRAKDGIRSFIVARRDFSAPSWGNTSMSHEVERIINYDDNDLLGFSSAVLFDNRLLMTCSPVRVPMHGVVHRGLIALDFHETTSIRRDGMPAYDGLWTGPRILQVLKLDYGGTERCFAFTLNSDNEIELYEITVNEPNDNVSQRIVWSIETPSYRFEDNGTELKHLQTGDVWFDELVGQVDFTVQYRPDQYAGWVDWHNWTECATSTCFEMTCLLPVPEQPQFRTRQMLPQPSNAENTANKSYFRDGYEFQQRLLITGSCKIKKSRIVALQTEEQPYEPSPTEGECQSQQLCVAGPFSVYSIE